MINIVVVSHSALLARGVEQLARQMMRGDGCKLALAAGVDDEQHPIGTDAVKVMEAIEAVADGDGVLVLMDLGSALLSAETALDLLDRRGRQSAAVCGAAGRRHAGGGGRRQLRRLAGAGSGGGAGCAAG